MHNFHGQIFKIFYPQATHRGFLPIDRPSLTEPPPLAITLSIDCYGRYGGPEARWNSFKVRWHYFRCAGKFVVESQVYKDHAADLQSQFCRAVFCREKFYRTEFIGNFPLTRTTHALAAPDAR